MHLQGSYTVVVSAAGLLVVIVVVPVVVVVAEVEAEGDQVQDQDAQRCLDGTPFAVEVDKEVAVVLDLKLTQSPLRERIYYAEVPNNREPNAVCSSPIRNVDLDYDI